MSILEMANANKTKANAIKVCVYTVHNYTLTNTANTFQINQQQQACGTNMRIHRHKLSRKNSRD